MSENDCITKLVVTHFIYYVTPAFTSIEQTVTPDPSDGGGALSGYLAKFLSYDHFSCEY
jgi:hypothetical protein